MFWSALVHLQQLGCLSDLVEGNQNIDILYVEVLFPGPLLNLGQVVPGREGG